MSRLHDVFKPVKKGDDITSINLYREAVVVHFERRERTTGAERRDLKTQYYKVAHPSVIPNLFVNWINSVTRILFFRPGALLVPLATGNRVGLDLYVTNNTEKLDTAGMNQESLSINVKDLGYYTLDVLTSYTSGDFGFFGPGVKNPFNSGSQQDQKWADIPEYFWNDTQIIARYPAVAK